jgi:hypothetical protein
LEKVEKVGTWNKIEVSHNNRQMGNGVERPRPQTTQLGAWRDGDKLRSKNKQEQALLAKERPHVSRKSYVEANISSFFIGVNGAPTSKQPMPLQPPP